MMRLLSRRFSSTHGCASVPEGVLTAYGRLVNAGRLREDAGQASTVQTLQALQSNLKGPQATGVYLWGPVGSGKSMLMDLVFRTTPGGTRLHYHELMQSIHQGLHALQEAQPLREVTLPGGRTVVRRAPYEGDPVAAVASQVAAKAGKLLCIDEMQVTDVADAMVLRQFLEQLLANRVNMVFTSNVPPSGLYAAPYLEQSRKFFLPCIELLENELQVCRVGNAKLDYRSLPKPEASADADSSNLVADVQVGCWSSDPQLLQSAWTGRVPQPAEQLFDVGFGRSLSVLSGRVADSEQVEAVEAVWLEADQVLQTAGGHAWGPPDFLALAAKFGAVYLNGLKAFDVKEMDEARRAVLLIDATYE